MIRIAVLALVGAMLGGCMQTLTGSVAGGESKVFERPPYVVLGKTQYDQNVVDNWVEGGVAAYGWKRPAPRPAYLDAPNKTKAMVKVKMPKKKPGFVQRVKDKIANYKKPEPVPYLDMTPPVVILPPQEPVDQLLTPR